MIVPKLGWGVETYEDKGWRGVNMSRSPSYIMKINGKLPNESPDDLTVDDH